MNNPFEFKPAGDAEAFRNAHKSSDTDAERLSMHHTLGAGSTQAAPGNHNHDGDYSSTSHNHDAAYAAIDHNHDAEYAAIDHNHDGDYAAIDHNHDSEYAPLVHEHSDYYIAEVYASNTTTINNTTDTDVTDLTITVPVGATTDVFKVTADLDISQTTASASGILLVDLWVNGSQYTANGITFRGSGSNDRKTTSKTWLVTGISVGNIVFKLRARLNSGTTPTYTISQPRSHFMVERVSPIG